MDRLARAWAQDAVIGIVKLCGGGHVSFSASRVLICVPTSSIIQAIRLLLETTEEGAARRELAQVITRLYLVLVLVGFV